MYRLFLDDERFPPRDGNRWVIARSYDEFTKTIKERGFPLFISFDHDLGGEKTGHDCVKYLIEQDMQTSRGLSKDFDFYVHSQNPVGRKNIESLMFSYLKYKGVRT